MCQRMGPVANVTLAQWDSGDFMVHCEDADSDLGSMLWYRDVDLFYNQTQADSHSIQNFEQVINFEALGHHTVQATAVDGAGHRSLTLTWDILVQPRPEPTDTPSATTGGLGTKGDFLSSMDPIQAFTALVGGIVGIGGLALGFVKLRRRVPAGDEEDAAAPPAGGVTQDVHGNSGTVVGSAGTVIIGAPLPAPPRVPSGVPPRKQDLYLSLEEARDVLDAPEAGEQVINARDMVQEALEDLRQGRVPLAGNRRPTADAIDCALASSLAPRIQAGAAALRKASEELRK